MFGIEGYSYKADMFSLGSVFFNLLTNAYLFLGERPDSVLANNIQCVTGPSLEYLEPLVSPECHDLITSMV